MPIDTSTIDIKAFWHKESYDRFLQETLPQLLAERLPLSGYHVEATGTYTCKVVISVANEAAENANGDTAAVEYNIPQPDEHGIFLIRETRRTVVPRASSEHLERATVLCVGEMLYELLQERLGEAPDNLPWDETLLRSWLPLDTWLQEIFFKTPEHPYEFHFQYNDPTNWLAARSHLRRLFMVEPQNVTTPGQFGRLCPFEKPEGPNLGRIGTIAVGAAIRHGKLVIEDDRPEATLGLSMSVIPLSEHCDANRLLMGANMMRQWRTYDDPEPALVQTGNEPSVLEFWCGRNVLTAFIPWGADTVDDAIVLSESGVQRLSNSDHQVEPGDKLSNRFGMKGVVSRILPDAEMPQMADGTPIQLLFSGVGLHSRLTTAQLREAVLGRLARAEGTPIVAPPFHSPSVEEIQQRLRSVGLPEDGMEILTNGASGKALGRPSLVGWVYWGRTDHLARDKMTSTVDSSGTMQRQTELEYQALSDVGAFETIREHFHTRAAIPTENGQVETTSLTQQVASRSVEHSAIPTLRFVALQRRLQATGIRMTLDGDSLHFNLQQPDESSISLAQPVSHPWLAEFEIGQVGMLNVAGDQFYRYAVGPMSRERVMPNSSEAKPSAEQQALQVANEKLARLQESKAPSGLIHRAHEHVEQAVHAYFETLLTPEDLHFDSRVLFSGRSVLAPGANLRYDEIGIGEEMAWALFGPLATRELGGPDEVEKRTERASQTLDQIMAQSWLILNRIPTISPNALVSFHPVRMPDRVIRIHPMVGQMMDADFDGDQGAIYLPITEGGQREAGERLSLAGHLARNPALIEKLAPYRDFMLGLALHSRTPSGQAEIEEIIGGKPDMSPGYLVRSAIVDTLLPQIAHQSAEQVLAKLDSLTKLGFQIIQQSGISLGPFVTFNGDAPEPPASDNPAEWQSYIDQRVEQFATSDDFDSPWGPNVLATRCGALAENRLRALVLIMFARGVVTDVHGKDVVIPHSFVTGLTPQEQYATVAGALNGLRRWGQFLEESSHRVIQERDTSSFHVLARARRSAHPGIVFARAAAIGEVDPLVDRDSRLFVGLPVGDS